MEWYWNFYLWLAVVAIVGIIAAVIVKVVNRNAQAREHVADAANGGNYKLLAERADESAAQLLARLDAIEGRLTAIEKTLTDIP